MCFFPYANNQINGTAYKKGITEYKCGCCPECLGERARVWTLRCSAQAEVQPAVMVTLTYDTYIRDTVTGRIIGERVSDFSVCKKDGQKFIKRLREYFSRVKNVDNIKYVLTAEYGKRTHRAHYHAILFGVTFDDLIKYKKSKRGNWIYKSATLDKIWKHGICTVDCTNISAKVARYCTKYCAKDGRSDDTFMLFSHGIGRDVLLKKFNGRSYLIDGSEYPIPRDIWQHYIERKYDIAGFSRYTSIYCAEDKLNKRLIQLKDDYIKTQKQIKIYDERVGKSLSRLLDLSPKRKSLLQCCHTRQYLIEYHRFMYENNLQKAQNLFPRLSWDNHLYKCIFHELNSNSVYIKTLERANYRKEIYRFYRDNDSVYKRYLQYWQEKVSSIEKTKKPVRQRILELPNEKYFGYKQFALQALNARERWFSLIGVSSHVAIPRGTNSRSHWWYLNRLPFPSRHKTANDRIPAKQKIKRLKEVTDNECLDRLGVPYGQISLEIHEKFKNIFDLCLT